MTADLTPEDIAALREQGDLEAYLRALTGRIPAQPKPAPPTAVPDPGYRIAHPGAWPLGTAASGPTPPPGCCSCPACRPAPATPTRNTAT